MNTLIFVVCHKNSIIPNYKPYKSISVGPNKDSISSDWRDDTLDNIANKNPNYCELTAQYWIWKNVAKDYDTIGLCHYRRYFANSNIERFKRITSESINKYLKKADIIMPEKWYWDESICERYFKCGQGKEKDLYITKQVIDELYPEYADSYNYIMNGNNASYCNMTIMKKDDFLKYNEWLFNILFEVEKRVDLKDYSKEEARIFGYLSEILLNIWILNNKLVVKYLPIIETEISAYRQIRRDIRFYRRKKRND